MMLHGGRDGSRGRRGFYGVVGADSRSKLGGFGSVDSAKKLLS